MCNRTQLCVIAVVACLVVAGFWAVLAVPGPALAGKPERPPGSERQYLLVEVFDAAEGEPPFEPNSPVWAPTSADLDCIVQTFNADGYGFGYRHDLRGTVVTSTGVELTDDVSCSIYLDRQGRIVELKVRGQDVIGTEGIMHVSEVVHFDPPVVPPPRSEVFVLPVHVDDLPIWRTDSHTMGKKTKLVEMVGTISIGDIVYSPLPPE